MYEQPLIQAGLSKEQASVYEALLKLGPSPARKIAQNSPYKRSLVYKILDELIAAGLATKKDEVGKVSVFEPAHPLKLKEFAEKKAEAAKQAQTALDSVLSGLVSDFNLVSGKPGVKFYEGLEGIQKILADSLTAATEIYSYIDNEAVNKHYPKINEEYVGKRNQKQIHKKMLTIDSAYIRVRAKKIDRQTTEIRVIPEGAAFSTVMYIYDNKVSYLSLDKGAVIGILIEHPQIAKMHKELFGALWQTAKPLFPLAPALLSSAATI